MKAVLISIKPKWCKKIAEGKKTIEVRKTFPKLTVPFKCYIYCTRGVDHYHYGNKFFFSGKVIGEFICDEIYSYGEDTPCGKYYMSESELADCCISYIELEKYANCKDLYGWHISEFKIYDKPKELREFCYPAEKYCDKGLCDGCPYYEMPILKSYGDVYDYDCEGKRPLKRPPQSWYYVEELK